MRDHICGALLGLLLTVGCDGSSTAGAEGEAEAEAEGECLALVGGNPTSLGDVTDLQVVAADGRYAVFSGSPSLAVQWFDATGTPEGVQATIFGGTAAQDDLLYHNVVWTGDGFLVGAQDESARLAITLALDAEARPGGPPVVVHDEAGTGREARVAWSPALALGLVAWEDTRSRPDCCGLDIYARVIDARGVPAGAEARLSDGNVEQDPWTVAASDDGFLVAWEAQPGGLALRAVDAAGQPAGEMVGLAPDFSAEHPVAVALGSGYALSWEQELLVGRKKGDEPTRVQLTLLDPDGRPLGKTIDLGPGRSGSLTAGRAGLAVAFGLELPDVDTCRLALLDDALQPRQDAIDWPRRCVRPTVASDGEGLLAAWRDGYPGNAYALLFACGRDTRPGCSSDFQCFDGEACTSDRCVDGNCVPFPIHGRCGSGELCDSTMGCERAPACNAAADCPIMGACSLATCDGGACAYATRDGDGDGYLDAVCGGLDCDDLNESVRPDRSEECNNIDDDCDGVIDGLSRPCGPAIGACEPGTETCEAGEWSACLGGTGPSGEICNGEDDNCNGEIDDGWDRAGPCQPLPEVCPGEPGGAGGIDLLFVIDNSNSMQGEQDLLVRQFPVLLDQLGGLDLHIGVTSTDLGAGAFNILTCGTFGGDGGRLLGGPPACNASPADLPFIRVSGPAGALDGNVSDSDDDGDVDYDDVAAAFQCIALLGTGGCGFEQPLEAMLRALSGPNACPGGANEGFLREDAALAVVFLTDEDDCSAYDGALFDPSSSRISDPLGPLQSFRCFEFGVACDQEITREGGETYTGCAPSRDSPYLFGTDRYVNLLRALKPAGNVVVAAITGPFDEGDAVLTERDQQGNPDVAPSCYRPDAFDQAAPAIRIRSVVDGMGEDGIWGDAIGASICSDSLHPVLDELAYWLWLRAIGAD